jgi:hypothetical protein
MSANPMAGRNEARWAAPRDIRQTWFTPANVLRAVALDLGGAIDYDPCPGRADVDGLASDWGSTGTRVYCNPPYGHARRPWVDACIWAGHAGLRVVLLIPAATNTATAQVAMRDAHEIVFVAGRITFEQRRPNGIRRAQTGPSMLLGWNVQLRECGRLGVRVTHAIEGCV